VCLCVRCVLVCTVGVSVYAECVYSVCLCEGCAVCLGMYGGCVLVTQTASAVCF